MGIEIPDGSIIEGARISLPYLGTVRISGADTVLTNTFVWQRSCETADVYLELAIAVTALAGSIRRLERLEERVSRIRSEERVRRLRLRW